MIHRAIMQCGRPVVLSLSPGPALIEKAWHYQKYANMWRITDDFWDSWPLLKNMFERCELWQNHVSEGSYPDCDMLPLGYIGKGFGQERYTRLTKDEQLTMMTLWCIFRSPLMIGAELTKLDKWTYDILTNKKVLRLIKHSYGAKQVMRDEKQAAWLSKDTHEDAYYLALFNLSDERDVISIDAEEIGELDSFNNKTMEELWTGKIAKGSGNIFRTEIDAHGAKLFKIY